MTEHPAAVPPRLTIAIPTYDCDVGPFCLELFDQMARLSDPGACELLVLIDGNPNLLPLTALETAGRARGLRITVAVAEVNLGRARVRNRLAQLAAGDFILFLDADGMPDHEDFVARYLSRIGDPSSSVVLCGGRSNNRTPAPTRTMRLFVHHCRKREWVPAAVRMTDPAANFLSANFCVARSFFLAHPFDPDFSGWGWEDTEWAFRIEAVGTIVHVDNTVSHMENFEDAVWVERLAGSVVNYGRLYRRYPDKLRRHRIFRLVRWLQPVGGFALLREGLRRLVLFQAFPTGLRLTLLKLFQALVFTRIFSPRSDAGQLSC